MMKKIKISALVIMFVAICSVCSLCNVNASKIVLNKKSATVYVNKTVKLNVKNTKKKVKWTSKNKKIATVSKKGKVTGKKQGKTYIYATISKKKLRCKITVKKKTSVKNPVVSKPTKEDLEWNYQVVADGIKLMSYKGTNKEIIIPDTIGGVKVCSMEKSIFENNKSIESVDISKNVKTIAENAFKGCTNLKKVITHYGTEIIDYYAFGECTNLNSLTLANSIKNIREHGFFKCESLKDITLPNKLETIGGSVFSRCTSLVEIEIPNSVKNFGEYNTEENKAIFYGCTKLKKIKLSNSCESIPAQCFCNCIALEEINIPENIKYIDYCAFKGCISLKEITTEAWLIDCSTFQDCTQLETADVSMASYLGGSIFRNCINLKTVKLCKYMDEIWDKAFENCIKLEEISNEWLSLDYAGNDMFKGCRSLVTAPCPINEFGSTSENCFEGCISLKNVKMDAYTIKLADGTFKGCKNLETIFMPARLTNIVGNPFQGCESLNTIYGKTGSIANEYAIQNGMQFIESNEVIKD